MGRMDTLKAGVCRITSAEGVATGFLIAVIPRRRVSPSRDPRGALLHCIVTASHCLPTRALAEGAKIVFSGGRTARLDPSTLLARDHAGDILIVAVRGGRVRLPPIPLSHDIAAPGGACVVIHHPKGGPLRVSRGIISAETSCALLHTVPTFAGSSGAPILDGEGEAVAVHLAANIVVLQDQWEVPLNEGGLIARVHAALRRVGYMADRPPSEI